MANQIKSSREAIEDCLITLYKNEGMKVSREGMLDTANAINNIVGTLVPNGVYLSQVHLSIAIDNAIYRIRMKAENQL